MPSSDQVWAAQELRLRFLYSIYDRQERGENSPTVADCLEDIDCHGEVWQRITEPLQDEGLIEGSDTAERGPVAVRLTSQGRSLVEDRVTGADKVASPASIGDVKVEGSGNVLQFAQHSPGSHFGAQVHFEKYDLRKIGDWADDVERRVETHGLQPTDESEVLAQVAELKSELSKAEPDHSRLQRIGRVIVRILSTTTATLASAGLIETGQRLFGG